MDGHPGKILLGNARQVDPRCRQGLKIPLGPDPLESREPQEPARARRAGALQRPDPQRRLVGGRHRQQDRRRLVHGCRGPVDPLGEDAVEDLREGDENRSASGNRHEVGHRVVRDALAGTNPVGSGHRRGAHLVGTEGDAPVR